jgi:hypothetical protein
MAPGDILCFEGTAFQAVVDFVACVIGGFVFLPVSRPRLSQFSQQLGQGTQQSSRSLFMAGEAGQCELTRCSLPPALSCLNDIGEAQLVLLGNEKERWFERLVALSAERLVEQLLSLSASIRPEPGSSRLTCLPAFNSYGFVLDLLQGVYDRQTIYLRRSAEATTSAVVTEAIDLEVDDLAVTPALLEQVCDEASTLDDAARERLGRMRVHTGGLPVPHCLHSRAAELFAGVYADNALTESGLGLFVYDGAGPEQLPSATAMEKNHRVYAPSLP